MANFANLTAALNLNIQNFATNMRRAATQTNQFAANLSGQINGGLVDPAKKAKFEFKDVARIVQGIIISKIFYSGLESIRACTDAVWEFAKQLEYAHIAYSNLFGDQALAAEFINVLKDFAAKTPFSFQESEQAAKRLLAYGVEYKNVMYMMQGIMSAASMQGDPRKVEQISRALGQIYTKGRLMNEEMRQLAEAGIPAYEILRQKLNLTQKQLQNLGRESIPASKAINALVDGMTERFGNVVTAAAKTITGIISNIKDNFVMLSAGLLDPLIQNIKAALVVVGDLLFKLRDIFEMKGAGGVFEALIPPELQSTIRTFIANLMNLWTVVKINLVSIFEVFKHVILALIMAFNALAPAITMVLDVFSRMSQALIQNKTLMQIFTAVLAGAAAMWVVFKLQALSALVVTSVCKAIVAALKGIAIALTFILVHPIWALLITVTGLVVGLSGGFTKMSESIRGFFKSLTSFNGVDPDKVLLPSQKERANDLGKFNNKLTDTKDAMDELADSTGKATKAAKGLLSFDEVFKLNQPDEGTDKGAGSEMPDFEVPDLSGMGGDAFMPEIPEFGGYAADFVDNLLNAIKTKLKERFASAGIGALLGGLLGGILGGPLGAKIGAVAGAIAGWFWKDIAEALGLTDTGKIALPIATMLGAAIGGLLGGPLGALVGGGIGALVGWLIDRIAYGLETGDWSGVALPAGIGIGAAIGFIIGGPGGAAIGGAIGALVGWISGEFIKGFTTGEWNEQGIGLALGGGIGAAIGMCVGGPVGALIGGAIGALVGWIVGLIVENWSAITDWFSEAFSAIGDFFVKIGSAIGEGFGSMITTVGGFFSDIGSKFSEGWNGLVDTVGTFFTGIGTWFSQGLSDIGTWLSDVTASIATGVSNWFAPIGDFFTKVGTGISKFAKDLYDGVMVVFGDVKNAIGTVMTDIFNAVTTVFGDMVNAVGTVLGRLLETASNIFGLIKDLIVKVVTDIYNSVVEWFTPIANKITETCSAAWESVSKFFTDILTTITTKVTEAWNAVTTFFGNIVTTVTEKLQEAWNTVSKFFGDILTTMIEKLTEMWNNVVTFFGNIVTTMTEKLTEAWSTVTTFFGNIVTTITEKLTEAWNKVTELFGNMVTTITTKVTEAWNKVTEVFGNIVTTISTKLNEAWTKVKEFFGNMYTTVSTKITEMYTSVKTGIANIYTTFKNWISDMWTNVFDKFFGWIDDGIAKLRDFFGLEEKAKAVDTDKPKTPKTKTGHATGGIFNREHVARFAEGNKAEAVIPLENAGAMQPFVDAISSGLTQTLAPMFAMAGGQNQLQPLYVGTLIADERSLRELQRKMNVIQLKEDSRRGF